MLLYQLDSNNFICYISTSGSQNVNIFYTLHLEILHTGSNAVKLVYVSAHDQTNPYSDVATGSNTSYMNAALGDKTLWHQHTHHLG